MTEKLTKQQLLDFAAAEGMFRERLSTLGNLAKVLGLPCHCATCYGSFSRKAAAIAKFPWTCRGLPACPGSSPAKRPSGGTC